MGFADFDIMGKCKTIIEKVEEIATNLSEVKTSASGAKTSADSAKASADTAASNTSVIGATGNTGGSATAGTVMGKLNKLITDLTTHMGRWTNTRAGYIDNIRSYTLTNNTANKTGVLSQKLAYVISLLENSSYGLAAIDKHYELSDDVLSTLISSETYTSVPSSDVTESYVFMYCGSFIPKHSGFVKIKLDWKPGGTDGNGNYGGKTVYVLVSDEDMTPNTSNAYAVGVALAVSKIRKACQSLSIGAIGEAEATVYLNILERICPYVYSYDVVQREDEIIVPVTKGKPIYILGQVQKTHSSSDKLGGPRIYSLTVCGKEVNN